MENWFQHIFLVRSSVDIARLGMGRLMQVFAQSIILVAAVLAAPLALAGSPDENRAGENSESREEVIAVDLEREPVNVGNIDAADFELGAFYGVLSIEDFGTDSVVGLRAAYHVSENLFLEGTYAESTAGDTSFELLSGSAQLLTDDQRDYSYYNVSLGYSILPGETFIAKRWAFNSALYLIAGIGSTEFAGDDHFTINFGAGYRILFNDWSALHIDVRDHLFDSDLLGESKTVHNIELSLGLSFFF